MWASVRDAWRSRRLLPWLGARMVVKEIMGTKLGRGWLVLRPFMDTMGMALIFGALLQVPSANGIPYPIFLMVGLAIWKSFERVVFYVTRSFDLFRKIMSTLKFPLILVPVSATAYPLIEASVYVAILTGAFLFYWLTAGTLYLQGGLDALVAVAGLAMALAFALAVSLWTSVLNGKARDVRMAMRYVLAFWFFLTPVVYPLSSIPPAFQDVVSLNPMTAPVEMVKFGLLGTGQVEAGMVLWSIGCTVAIMLSGLWFFNREAVSSIDRHGPDDDEEFM